MVKTPRPRELKPVTVLGLPKGSAAADGSFVVIELQTDGRPLPPLKLSEQALARVTSRLTQMVRNLIIRRGNKTGHFETPVTSVKKAMSVSPVGGGRVVVAFQTSNGLLYHYSMTPDQAHALRAEMVAAENSARKDAAATRQ